MPDDHAAKPKVTAVQAVTIERPGGKWGLLMRALPRGSWVLREYDENGDEEGRGA